MNTTQWIIQNNFTELPLSNMTMTNHSQAPGVPPTPENTLRIIITLLIILALLLIVFYPERSNDQQQRQGEQDKKRTAESQEKFRMKLIQKMTEEKLTMTLTSLNFRTGNDNTASTVLDMELGGGVPIEGETIGDETLPEITEIGGSVEIHRTDQKVRVKAGENEKLVGEPLANNKVNLRLIDETLDDKADQDVQQVSNEENTKVPDLEAGKWNRTNGSGKGFEAASIKSVKAILQKKRRSRRSTTGSSSQSEIFVKRAGNPLSIRNVCAICLDGYIVGDVIAWSGNVSCKHVFHQECILDYLVQRKSYEAPCPCCRRVFLPKDQTTSRSPQ